MDINIKILTKVVLTEEGVSVYNMYTSDALEEGDSLYCHLWELMQIFGPSLYNGGPTLFKENSIGL